MSDKQPQFKEDALTVSCAHLLPDGTPSVNFEGFTINLGLKAFIPCQRCLVAIREAIVTDMFINSMAYAVRKEPELAKMVANIVAPKMGVKS